MATKDEGQLQNPADQGKIQIVLRSVKGCRFAPGTLVYRNAVDQLIELGELSEDDVAEIGPKGLTLKHADYPELGRLHGDPDDDSDEFHVAGVGG